MTEDGDDTLGKLFGKIPAAVFRFFRNVKLTATVILLLILIYFLGLVLPQKWMFGTRNDYLQWVEKSWVNWTLDTIGFTDIYLSPVTIILLSLFFINLLVVISGRVPGILQRAFLRGESPPFAADEIVSAGNTRSIRAGTSPDAAAKVLASFFKKQRWYFRRGKIENTFLAVKHRLAPIGFLFFHLSFVLCLIGGLLIAYTRFSGNLVLTEGQPFENDIQQFYAIRHDPKIMKALPSLGLLVEKIHPSYEKDVPTELVVDLQVKYWDDVKREVLRVNEPIKRGPMSIIVKNIGVSPLFEVKNAAGEVVDSVFVSLKVLKGEEDTFKLDIDGQRYQFRARFFPDHVVRDGKETTNSLETRNPALHLTVDTTWKTISEKTIMLGESLSTGRFSIRFEDFRYWAAFQIVREYGRIPLIAGFLLGSIGLIMRLVFYQKRVRMAVVSENGKAVIYIDGKSEYYPYSFSEEFDELALRLERFLSGVREDND